MSSGGRPADGIASRLPQLAFALLAVATLGAFFLVQALKTTNPLIWPQPTPVPAAINPVHGRICISRSHQRLDYRHTQITLALPHADTVGVYVVSAANANGAPLATVSSGTPMRASPGPVDAALTARLSRVFTWNGRLAGGEPAPAGTYYFRITLAQQDRSINLSQSPVQVIRRPPRPRIVSVTDIHAPGASGPAVLSPPGGRVRIRFTPGTYRRVQVDIYRTDVAGPPQLLKQLSVRGPALSTAKWSGTTTWNGEIDGQPAPAGTYLVGLTAQDAACDQVSWPRPLRAAPGVTPHAGVTIRYLTVTPPLTPVVSGARASVVVDSSRGPFSWRLRLVGASRVLGRGSGPAGAATILVPMPRRRAALYTLTVSSGGQRAEVPLIASRAGRAATHAPVLVVLPMLTWMGDSPVDDSGDGFPSTLRAGDPVLLARPLVDWPSDGLVSDAVLLHHLAAAHLSYQLTTDVALAEGLGPSLRGRRGLVFADGEEFLPASLRRTLRDFVRGGGRVLTLGTGDFAGSSHISGVPGDPRAAPPAQTPTDPFGVRRGPLTPTGGEMIGALADPLGLFSGAFGFSGFGSYQPLEPPASAAATLSAAGIVNATPAVVGFRDGAGIVIEVGLPNFGSSLTHNADSQELLANAWRLLAAPG